MIRLSATNQSLEIDLAGAISTNQLDVVSSYSDATSSTYTGGTQTAQSNSTTAVTIVSAPAASTVRDIDYVNVQNADTASATVIIQINTGGTLRTLLRVTLLTGEQLVYTHGSGWCAMDASGNVKESMPGYLPLTGGTVSGATSFTSTIIPSQTNGIVGTTTNNSANAGSVGEYIASVATATNFPTSTQWGDLTSIALSVGDWDVSVLLDAAINGATMTGGVGAGLSTTSGNTTPSTLGSSYANTAPPTSTANTSVAIPGFRVSLAAPATYYLKYAATYSAGTPQATGRISARRVR